MKLAILIMSGLVGALALSGCTPAGIVVGGVAVAGVTIAEERSVRDAVSDANIKVKILNSFIQESESLFVDVSTIVIEGRVLVTGQVPSQADQEKAVSLIWPIEGVKAVLNELQISREGTVSSTASDAWISAKLKASLLQDLDIKHINYSVDTVNRVVYVMGIAQDQAEAERVYRQAKDIAGVRKIVSHVVLKESRQ